MNPIINCWRQATRFEKWLCAVSVILLIGIGIAPVLYLVFGKPLITSVYEGNSIDILNRFIQYQHEKPLEHYLEIGDSIFQRLFLIASVGFPVLFGIIFIVYRLIYTEKKVGIGIVMLWAMLMLSLLYMLNAYNRIYSYHGFFRASIVYQILSGNIPPQDFLFAGQPLRWPWGFACIIAGLSKLFHLSPFYTFALVNILSLGASVIIIYQISKLLIPNSQANIFSVLFSIFGATIFSRGMTIGIFRFIHSPFMELRALPPFLKYSNANGMPAGLIFFLLFVYATIRLLENRRIFLFFIMILVSLIICGFIYTGFIPAILASVIVLFIARLLPWSKSIFGSTWQPWGLLITATVLAGAVLWPYIQLASSGMGQGTEILNLNFIVRNMAVYLFFMLPILSIILFAMKGVAACLQKQRLVILTSITIAASGCYFCLHFPQDVEYKFLFLSGILSGIPGGIAFSYLAKKVYKGVALVLLCAFVFPAAADFSAKLTLHGNHPVLSAAQPPRLIEKGIYVRSANRSEDELYQWIIEQTPQHSVFVDTEWLIPVFAQRRLLFGIDRLDGTGRLGFTMNSDYLSASLGYEPSEFTFRRSLVRNIYGIENTMSRSDVLQYLTDHHIYVVVRKDFDGPQFNSHGLTLLFQTTNGEISLYQTSGPDQHTTPSS